MASERITVRCRKHSEKGSALIAVLCFMMLAGLLAASAIAMSRIGAESASVAATRMKSAYIAEGAATRMQWLLMNDLTKNPDRQTGSLNYTKTLGERYLADGVPHILDYYGDEVEIALTDAASGIDISGASPSSAVQTMMMPLYGDSRQRDKKQADIIKAFAGRIDDYVDGDDFIRLNGFEAQDYVSYGMPNMPRNAPFKFKEEIMLIPGFSEIFRIGEDGLLTQFRPVPPQGMPQISGLPSFFSATEQTLEKLGRLRQDELGRVLEARKNYLVNHKPLNESLDPALLAKMKSSFSFRESGFFTFTVRPRLDEGRYGRTLVLTMKVDKQPQLNSTAYYEWIIY